MTTTSLNNFKTYQLAKNVFFKLKAVKVPTFLRDQLDRASSSVVLNLAEGSAKFSKKDQARFYQIARGSLLESISIIEISAQDKNLLNEMGIVLAHLNNLIRSRMI